MELKKAVVSSTSGCILIEGEDGCGKSSMAQMLRYVCGLNDDDVVTLHMGEQIDSKVGVLYVYTKYMYICCCDVLCGTYMYVVVHIQLSYSYFQTLVGTFTCTGIPGEFVWLPGILAQVCCVFFEVVITCQ